ncbi:hypothetical protein HNP55_004480 [Paucibacter oligotrophus]|uniref:Uncharacterized protein n=1 Tax=Roseateles oligotrophus TaxID=1769250 RepID=A0A840LCN8_9BURK|nr:CopG family transcriptional regulator [Roseateles oligotrophus]MBB4845926.1 hypothetical protein [Roseateles oligotrophus]
MRTTLSLDDDVLLVAKSMAERERKTLGEVISALARKALQPEPGAGAAASAARNGIPLLARKAQALPVTPELVNQLREELL